MFWFSLAAAFAGGVLLTALVALYVIGLIHAEAARAVDDHMLALAQAGCAGRDESSRPPRRKAG